MQALLDVDGDGGTTAAEFMQMAKQCMAAEKGALGKVNSTTHEALNALRAYLKGYTVRAWPGTDAAAADRLQGGACCQVGSWPMAGLIPR